MRIGLVVLLATLVSFADAPPRYALVVGQELVYETSSEYRYRALLGLIGDPIRRKRQTRIWVVRRNADGSFRLWVRHQNALDGEEPDIEIGWCHLFPDGRFVLSPYLGLDFDPAAIFKPLPPASATTAASWEGRNARGERLKLRTGADGALEEEATGGILAITEMTKRSRALLKAGLPSRIETVSSKKNPSDGKETATTLLVREQKHRREAVEALDRELRAFTDVLDATGRAMLRAETEEAYTAAYDEQCKRLEALREKAKHPVAHAEIERFLSLATQWKRDSLRDWRRKAERIGTPAPDWTLEDLDGKRHALKDYRGKVVVLDFWFAECGPCLRAMPALKRVAARYPKRVAVLGMNTDGSADAARRVAKAMALTYPTLRARGQRYRYRVAAFPTFVILDASGRIRRVHEGFGSRLEDELVASIEPLLADRHEKPRR